MGDLRGLRVQVRKRSQALPDGARRKVGLLELDPEGHMTLCQDGCCLGCSLLIPTLYGLGQAPCQLFCRGRESHYNPTLAASPSPSGRLPLPFSIRSPGLQGRSTLGWGALGVGTSRGLGGETGHVSGPRAGGKLSLPRRKDMGWAGGLFEIWPPTEYIPRPVLSPQASSTFVSSLLTSAHARALPWPHFKPDLGPVLALAHPRGPC